MAKGISNFQIDALKNMNNDDIDDNFVGVFPSNHVNQFIDHAAMISERKGKYSSIVANTDSSEKGGTHWWSILNIEPKQDIFFFDSFGLDGLKHFIIQDDRNVIEKILFGTEKMTRTDNKVTFFNVRFNPNAYKNLSVDDLDALSDTASKFFHFIQAFGNKPKLRNFVNIWMVEDRVQNLDSLTCGIFQLYFYNLFSSDENSKIQDKARLNKSTIETLLNEVFVLDNQDKNEELMRQYAADNNISMT